MKQAAPSLRKGQQRLDKLINVQEYEKKDERNNTPDLLVLPSTSTFTLKDDKQEKLKKKAKNFLDEKQKIKTRAQSLWSYIDATNSFDQARFFQENAEQVFQVVYDTCIHQIEKIKHRSERPQSWNSKELVNLQKTLFLLRKVFLFVPELMRNGWQRQNITTILTHILDHRNHPRLRALGFQLLLLWLNDQVVEYPECMHLFSNAISLDLFILDEITTIDKTQPTTNPPTSTTTNTTNNAPYVSPVTVNLMTNEQTEDVPHGAVTNNNHNKLHSGGLQFVKKLRETHSDKGQAKHSLKRDERIKSSRTQLKQSFILVDESSAPLFPSPTQPTYNDSLVLIHIFISNLVRLAYVGAGSPPPPDDYEYPLGDQFEPDDGIATGVGIDAATASAKFLFKIFRTHYMTKFVPLISKSLYMDGTTKGKELNGFPSCPPSILRCLFRFLIGYCLDNDSNGIHMHWPNLFQSSAAFTSSSPAIPILKSIVLSSHETREMLHEIIRQALVLPCTNAQYRDITRGAIHILGVWILGNEDERPSFLRRSGSAVTRSSSTTSAVSTNNVTAENTPTKVLSASPVTEDFPTHHKTSDEQSDANVFLRRYLLMIKLIFEDHRPSEEQSRDAIVASVQQVTDWEGLVALYKDAINLYRAIVVSKGGIDIEWESWELLLHCLLDIQQWLMSQPEKYSRVPVQSLAEDLASYIWETVFHAFVRAKIVHLELWRQLKTHMVSSMRWTQALQQWVKIMHSMTRLLSTRLYKVEYDFDKNRTADENIQQSIHFTSNSRALSSNNNNKNKVRSRHLSIQGNPKGSTSTSNKHNSSGRPLSSCGSEGQLVTGSQDKQSVEQQYLEPSPSNTPAPEGSVSTILRNLSSASLSDIASTFKADRKSTNLTSVPDGEEVGEEQIAPTKQNVKFGIKNIIPTASFSNTSSHTSSSGGNQYALTSSTSTVKRVSGSHASASGHGTVSSTGGHEKISSGTGRRTISIQQLDSLWQDSGSKLLNFVHHGNDGLQVGASKGSPVKHDEKKIEWDRKSGSSSVLDDVASSRSNRTSTSAPWPLANATEALSIIPSSSAVSEKLPAGLGSFKSSDFLNLNNLPYDGQQILTTWKNALFAAGNINQIEGAHNHAIAMQCVVDILDTFKLIRAQQSYCDVPIPAMYEVIPWLFEATELPNTFEIGKASAYGSLCRLMSQISEEEVPEGYYTAFYKAILNGLGSKNTAIVHAILLNSERLFSFSLPSIYILIPPFTEVIEKELLNCTGSNVPLNVRRSCVKILGSFVPITNQLKDITISLEGLDTECIPAYQKLSAFSFIDIKVWIKNVLIKLVENSHKAVGERETEVHCMLLGALCASVLDEMSMSESRQNDTIYECVLSLVNHLYWCNISVINTVANCISTFAQIYKGEADPAGIIIQEVLTHIIDALNIHLKYYEKNIKTGRGFIISKLFSCLLEWIMSIDPVILVETDLSQLVFDVIELAIHLSSDGNEKILPHSPRTPDAVDSKKKETAFKFKLGADKRPDIQQNEHIIGSDALPENDQAYVKESAEAVLLHLLHHFNNFAPPCGPATLHSTIVGPGISQDDSDYQQYQYFSFNDTTIIAFVELFETKERQARMIVRDLTGRYVWDTLLEPKIKQNDNTDTEEDSYKPDQRFIQNNEDKDEKPSLEAEEDSMSALLKQIGDTHPDCLLDTTLPLNVPSTPTALQLEMLGNLGDHLSDYLKKETEQNTQQAPNARLWYSKMNALRQTEIEDSKSSEPIQSQLIANLSSKKDFLPAFPEEVGEPHVPFLYSRLLMSHLGLIEYDHLKDGYFQILNKNPSLYRDIRGLDRKHGRETMKIGLIYVGNGQEDEQIILQNSQGSKGYNAFVNSLGWEIDIATHTGYLGGLERNLTNGSKATYYCSSTLEMIFHDVTKMPTDPSDPKQLKKKRHIGNDHVHIVWNEHERDYRTDTIGGDFGNAQIIVKPLPNSLYFVQIHRDSKVPYFGPLYDRMIVSQASLGPLVRSTAIDAFRATVHTNFYSFYKCVYAQRASDIRTITQRHKFATWSYEQFMEKVFMLEE